MSLEQYKAQLKVISVEDILTLLLKLLDDSPLFWDSIEQDEARCVISQVNS